MPYGKLYHARIRAGWNRRLRKNQRGRWDPTGQGYPHQCAVCPQKERQCNQDHVICYCPCRRILLDRDLKIISSYLKISLLYESYSYQHIEIGHIRNDPAQNLKQSVWWSIRTLHHQIELLLSVLCSCGEKGRESSERTSWEGRKLSWQRTVLFCNASGITGVPRLQTAYNFLGHTHVCQPSGIKIN